MSEIKVNKISPRAACGTVTLGDSGDTFTIPAGATINNQGTATNFGATGSASWVTTVKTSTFTAVAGEGYFVNTTGGAVTVNLPAGVAGAVVAIKDYANTFDTNAVTVSPNGSDKIGSVASDATLTTEGIAVTFVFVDSTQGWLVTDSGLQSELPTPLFITATGGTITTVGNFKIHTFTGPGTFAISCAGNPAGSTTVDYLVSAGGGGGGQGYYGGGGGAGGFRFFANTTCNPQPGSNPGQPLNNFPSGTTATVSASSFPITVGGGGAGAPGAPGNTADGVSGNPSTFSNITSAGGGGGDTRTSPCAAGTPGGSGGGGGANNSSPSAGGTGNTPPVSPPQGNPGGTYYGGGGGGAIAAGTSRPSNPYGGDGGAGAGLTGFGTGNGQCSSCVQYFSGGGGGGANPSGSNQPTGGLGGGGQGQGNVGGRTDATVNTGGGGGGGGSEYASGASGGSGIVVIRYKFQ